VQFDATVPVIADRKMTPSAFGLGYHTCLETLEQLSPLDGAERGLAEATTINNHQLSQRVDR
jgi:hypothetical protein